MQQKIILSFFLVLIFLNTKAQTCVGGGSSNMPTKCFEIESILADACGPNGNIEGQDEMIRLRIGPNPITLNSINTVVWQTVNSWLGFCSITGSTLTKINSINNSIIAAGNCGRFIPISPGGTLPAYSKVLFLTSTDFSATAHDFSGLTDTMYVIIQCAGNTGGHFTNSGNVPRTLVIKTSTCGDTVTWNSANLIGGNGAAINFTYAGVPSYVNYGCTLPVAPFSCDAGTTNPTYCNGSTLNLAGTVSGSNCYVWRASNTATGTFADTTNLLTTFTISTGYVGAVKLYLFTKSNCSVKKDSVMFNAIASSGVLNAGNDTSLCNSIAFQVSATSTATGTYAWTKSGAGTLNQTNILNPVYTPSLLDIGIVNLIVTQTTTCGVLKDTVKVTYTSKANASFTLSDSNFCYNNVPININLNPTVSGGVFSSNIGSIAANVLTFNAVGNFIVIYKIGSGSCADSLTKGVNSFAHANPNFTFNDTIVCKNAPVVVLTQTQAGGVFSGTRVIANRFTPDTVGIFGLKYKISNGACIDSLSKNIEVKAKPDPFFISSKTTFCLNDASTILIPSTSGGIFSGTNVSGAVFTPSTVGVFSVKYIVSNAFCVDSSSQNFTVFNKPNPTFTLSDTLVCIGSPTITLTPTQVGGIFSGTNVSAQIFSPITTGIFPIKYLISNANCADSAYKNIEVKPKPDPFFISSKTTFCLNDASTILIPSTSGGIFSGTNVSAAVFTPSTVGVFSVKYIVANAFCIDSSNQNFTVFNKPNPAFTLSDTLVCIGSPTITLTPTQVGGIFSGTNVSAQIFSPITTGIFPVKYLISNANCADSAYKNIEVKPKPDASFTTTDSVFCVNDARAIFTPTEAGGVFTGTNVLGNQYNPITVGNFIVKHVINNGTCADSSFKTMLVNPKPTANFTYTPANPYAYDTVYFTFTGANATKYYWSFGDLKNSSSNLKDPLFEFIDVNVYRTWLKVSNNEGCSDSIYKDVSVLKRETIFVPNVFTPQNTDGLGLNDYFTIRSYGINNYHMQIYNRWGSLLYETNNINPGWDGTFNGDSCPDGVYFYIIDAIGFSKKTYHLHGTVTLLR